MDVDPLHAVGIFLVAGGVLAWATVETATRAPRLRAAVEAVPHGTWALGLAGSAMALATLYVGLAGILVLAVGLGEWWSGGTVAPRLLAGMGVAVPCTTAAVLGQLRFDAALRGAPRRIPGALAWQIGAVLPAAGCGGHFLWAIEPMRGLAPINALRAVGWCPIVILALLGVALGLFGRTYHALQVALDATPADGASEVAPPRASP